jgi:hypothetical protein
MQAGNLISFVLCRLKPEVSADTSQTPLAVISVIAILVIIFSSIHSKKMNLIKSIAEAVVWQIISSKISLKGSRDGRDDAYNPPQRAGPFVVNIGSVTISEERLSDAIETYKQGYDATKKTDSQ